eukprot:g20989.t1
MQEGVSYELLHECRSNVLRGHLKLNKVVNWLKAEKNVFTSQFVIYLAKSTNDLIKQAQADAKKTMKKKMRTAKTPEKRKSRRGRGASVRAVQANVDVYSSRVPQKS